MTLSPVGPTPHVGLPGIAPTLLLRDSLVGGVLSAQVGSAEGDSLTNALSVGNGNRTTLFIDPGLSSVSKLGESAGSGLLTGRAPAGAGESLRSCDSGDDIANTCSTVGSLC